MSLLFLLPVEIWREHILQFHSLLDIVKVNSACSSRQVQLQMRSMMDGLTLKRFYSIAKGKAVQHRWCLERNILPLRISMCGDLDAETASVLPQLCARVTTVTIMESKITFQPVQFSCLVSLDVFECQLESLGSLAKCQNLTTLSLDGCSRLSTESLLSSLVECPNLTECTIENCEMIGQKGISQIWNQLPHLVSFQFGSNSRQPHPYNLSTIVENCTLKPSATFRLRSVVVSNCTVCGTGVRKLAGLFPLLQKISLSDTTNNVFDKDIEVLSRTCPQLKEVTLNNFLQLTSASLESIANCFPFLQRLSVAYCRAIDDEGVIAVAKGCAQLTALDISYCDKITDKAVQEVWSRCLQLQDLNLSGCVLVTDSAFTGHVNDTLRALHASDTFLNGTFLSKAPKLLRLYCDQCPNLNSEFVCKFVSSPNSLISLWLEETQLSVNDLLTLSTHLSQLQSLTLSASLANDEVVRSFVINCPYLQYLRLRQCGAVTEATKNELMLRYKRRLHISG